MVVGPRDLAPTFETPKGNCNHYEENIDGTNGRREVRTGTQNKAAFFDEKKNKTGYNMVQENR